MRSILLIEDNADILDNMKEFFELEGYQIFSTNNGTRGIELALACKPDLIICDMPKSGFDKYGVLHLLINNSDISTIPFIFNSTLSDLINKNEALKHGADNYIVKPFDLDNMLEMAKDCIRCGSKRQRCVA